MKKLIIILLILVYSFSYGKKINHVLCKNQTKESIILYKFIGNRFAYSFEDSEYKIYTDDNYRKTINKQLKSLRRKRIGKNVTIKDELYTVIGKNLKTVITLSSVGDFIIWNFK